MCLVSKSGLTFCNPIDCSLPGLSVHGISQARILEWVAISFSRGSSWPRDWSHVYCVSCIGRQILYRWATLGVPQSPPHTRRGIVSCELWWLVTLGPQRQASNWEKEIIFPDFLILWKVRVGKINCLNIEFTNFVFICPSSLEQFLQQEISLAEEWSRENFSYKFTFFFAWISV